MDVPVITDFGVFEGEVLLCGGPYSNLQAVEALVERAGERPVICTGDVVAYGADAAAVVARIRTLGWPVVAGNCERQLAEGALDCGCGFEEGSACDALSGAWYAYASGQIDDDARDWMADLPDVGLFLHQDRRYAVIHGGASAINRFIWPDSPEAVFEEEVAALRDLVGSIDGVIAGHSGIAFQRDVAGLHWINAGALGLPPHDGRPATRFAVLGADGVVIDHLTYDHDAAHAAMEAAGLTQGYHTTLRTGIWPSEDVLPQSLRR